MKENVDYQLIPSNHDEDAWDVRILTGEFNETVVRFGSIYFNGEDDCLNFSFDVVYTTDDVITAENVELQQKCGELLEAILEVAAQEGTLMHRDTEEGIDIEEHSG